MKLRFAPILILTLLGILGLSALVHASVVTDFDFTLNSSSHGVIGAGVLETTSNACSKLQIKAQEEKNRLT